MSQHFLFLSDQMQSDLDLQKINARKTDEEKRAAEIEEERRKTLLRLREHRMVSPTDYWLPGSWNPNVSYPLSFRFCYFP